MDLFPGFNTLRAAPYESVWRSPSNIALVKYWGKKGHQLPANPSISMTLKECFTETKVKFLPSSELKVELFLSGLKEVVFAEKIKAYLLHLSKVFPCLLETEFKIETKNTFPHGTGMASSASGLSAFALCLTDYLHFLKSEGRSEVFFQRASFLSRLASGSACRSIYGGMVVWGESQVLGSSDEYAVPFEVHPSLAHLNDTVLVISEEEKKVSSRKGHERMIEHAYAAARFTSAKKNFDTICSAFHAGDMSVIGSVMENEALQLHAMMLTAPESFILLRPNTLLAIEMVKDFRYQTQLPLYFTLDAGPNLHLIYPESAKNKINTFIANELRPLGLNVIYDHVGKGPLPCL